MPHILVSGMVAYRDKRPYVQLSIDGRLVQMTVAEARNVAQDILTQVSRAEADAMIHRFFEKQQFPEGAGAALMQEFREFRSELDREQVEKFEKDTDT